MNSYTHPDPVSNSPTSSRLHGKHNHLKNTAQNERYLHTIATPRW